MSSRAKKKKAWRFHRMIRDKMIKDLRLNDLDYVMSGTYSLPNEFFGVAEIEELRDIISK